MGSINFGVPKICGPEIFSVGKNLEPKKFWVQQNLQTKKVWDPKKTGSHKKFGSKNFGSKKFGSKNVWDFKKFSIDFTKNPGPIKILLREFFGSLRSLVPKFLTLSLYPAGTNQTPQRYPPETLKVTSRHPLDTLQKASTHLPDTLQTRTRHPSFHRSKIYYASSGWVSVPRTLVQVARLQDFKQS